MLKSRLWFAVSITVLSVILSTLLYFYNVNDIAQYKVSYFPHVPITQGQFDVLLAPFEREANSFLGKYFGKTSTQYHRKYPGHIIVKKTEEYFADSFTRYYKIPTPGNLDVLRLSFERKGFSMFFEPVGPLFGERVGKYLNLGNYLPGMGTDAIIGGLLRVVSDQYYYGLWTVDPGLAARRAVSGAGANVTTGVLGTSFALGIYAFVGATPAGWGFGLTALGITIYLDLRYGNNILDFWDRTLDASLP